MSDTKISTKEELEELLRAAGITKDKDGNDHNLKNTDRQYEINLGDISKKYYDKNVENFALEIINNYNNCGGATYGTPKAYSAFFSLIIFYRHQSDKFKLNNLWESRNKFESFDSFKHLIVLHILYNLDQIKTPEDADDYLQIARENIDKNKINPGFNHALADLYVSICEKFQSEPEKLNKIIDKWGDTATNAANKAINYEAQAAVFNCTYGRILSIMGNYQDSDIQFDIAISKEDSSRPDYSLRIGKYNYYRNLNQTRSQAHFLKNEVENLKINSANNMNTLENKAKKIDEDITNMRNALVSNVETIGIFSGIIAFVIGTLSIAARESAVESGLLILTLMGCLTASLSSFSLLLHLGDKNKNRTRTTILIIVISVLFSISSVITAAYLENKYNSPGSQTNTSEEQSNDQNDLSA